MIPDDKKWHYLAVKSSSALFREITSNHHGDFYCLNCFHSFRTKNVFKKHYDVCKDHDYCYVEMPNKDNNILKCNHGENFIKAPFIIYANLESLLQKIRTCHNNPNESSTIKINEHTPSGCSLFTYCSFDNTKNSLSYFRDQYSMKKFCKDLKEHTTKIINCEKKEMVPLTHEENES